MAFNMTNYKWADIASSESCASFGRTTMMLIERHERYNAIYKNGPNKNLPKYDNANKNKVPHYMLMTNDSYIDKSGIPEFHDSKSRLDLKFNNVKLSGLSHDKIIIDDKSIILDKSLSLDDVSAQSLNFNNPDDLINQEDVMDNKNVVQSFANFLCLPENVDKSLSQVKHPNTQRDASTGKENVNYDTRTRSSSVRFTQNLNGNTNHPLPNGTSEVSRAVPEMNKRVNSNNMNYYDEDTKQLLNPTKKANFGIKMDKCQKDELSQLLLGQLSKSDKNKVIEDTNTRIYSRLKDIAIGKATKGYQNYIRKVPIAERGPDDPQTPNSKENISASRFRAIYRAWRTHLHKYDNIS